MSWELFIAIGIFIAIPMTRLYRRSRDGEDWSDTPDSVGRLRPPLACYDTKIDLRTCKIDVRGLMYNNPNNERQKLWTPATYTTATRTLTEAT
jgi:hypothetical protein